ncbi:hypothetical protein SMD44_00863 [Streptomyces alboflavus]|uniref:Uncharacterized protein n=1 Tax=Streptomyces alboflavus TaxID=67267 RepID=A0A1Z1W4X2_9ACTN|nr:hypothetical protein SMD44_00863 [Streptomyces alboflavus]
MEGRATPTIETSSASRNIAAHSTSSVPHRRGVQRSWDGEAEPAGPAWPVRPVEPEGAEKS